MIPYKFFFFFLLTFGINTLAQKVHFKGNLLFKETGANYLNQEHMMFTRLLDTSDLTIFTQTYLETANTYKSFCDSIATLFYKINPDQTPPPTINLERNFTIISSTSTHTIAEAAAVCRSMGARLPEVRNRADDRDLLEAVERNNVRTVLAGAKFDIKSGKFLYESDLVDVASNTVYNAPYYGGSYTRKYHRASHWSDHYLIKDASNFYLTYVKANDGLAFRLSDKDTVHESNIILCQKPVPVINKSLVSTNLLIQMTMGYCTRDSQWITETTQQAITQIKLITSLDLNLNNNGSTLKNYLPHFERQKREVTTEIAICKNETDDSFEPFDEPDLQGENKTHCLRVNQTVELWPAIWTEYTFAKQGYYVPPVRFHPNVSGSVAELLESAYYYWYHLISTSFTNDTFVEWLNGQLAIRPLIMCNSDFYHYGCGPYQPDGKSWQKCRGVFGDKLYQKPPLSLTLFKNMTHSQFYPIPQNPFVRHKNKRDLATITGASIFGTLIGSSAYVIKSFIDLFSDDKYVKKSEFNKMATHINDIRINQGQIQNALRQVTLQMNHFEENIRGIYNGMAAQNMEWDIKNFNRYLQTVLANTLNSYAQAFLAAMDGKTSPYALSPTELQVLAAQMHAEKRITLDTNINNVRTTALVYNNTIRFFFEVPIISDESAFYFYTIIPVPAFHNNETFLPDIDASNVAISIDAKQYTVLTADESAKCNRVPPICETHKPISPISNKALCVISTYTTSQRTCKLKQSSSIAEPFLHFEDTFLYFSVPYNTSLFITCPPSKHNPERSEASITLVGMGQAQYRPSCTITLQDGTSFKTKTKVEVQPLPSWPLFNILKALPHNVETVIYIPTEAPLISIPSPIDIEDTLHLFPNKWDEKTERIMDIVKDLLTVMVPIFLAILCALCCKKRFVKWVRSLVYQGSYTFNKEIEDAKEDFQFLSIPITPQLDKRAPPMDDIEIEKQKNKTRSNSYAKPPYGDPVPLEQPIQSEHLPSILKPNKNVQFK